MKKKRPDAIDLKILRQALKEGPSFMKHAAHESRAHRLCGLGLLTKDQTVYKVNPGGAITEYRWCYSITPAGVIEAERAERLRG